MESILGLPVGIVCTSVRVYLVVVLCIKDGEHELGGVICVPVMDHTNLMNLKSANELTLALETVYCSKIM